MGQQSKIMKLYQRKIEEKFSTQRFGMHVDICTNSQNSEVTLGGKNNKGNVSIKINAKTKVDNVHELIKRKDSSCTYEIDYLSKILKAIGDMSNRVTIEYSSNKPIRLEFIILNSLKMQFYLAPRI
jgi:hypothetical protein